MYKCMSVTLAVDFEGDLILRMMASFSACIKLFAQVKTFVVMAVCYRWLVLLMNQSIYSVKITFIFLKNILRRFILLRT